MKVVTLLFWDSNLLHKDNQIIKSEVEVFKSELKKIKKDNSECQLLFSFIGQDDKEIIYKLCKEVGSFLIEEGITIGRQYFKGGYLDNTWEYTFKDNYKILQILDVLYLLERHVLVKQIYYASSCDFYVSILNDLYDKQMLPRQVIQVKIKNDKRKPMVLKNTF